MFSRDATNDEATRAAADFARENGLRMARGLWDGSEVPPDAGPLYNPPPDYPVGWWLGLATHDPPTVIRSSVVVGVSKWTGAVEVLGDSGDEG
jgi:hypothetical protein